MFIKNPVSSTPPGPNIGAIVGACVGVGLPVLIISIFAILYFLRNKDNTVENLPNAILRHYRQFNRSPIQWVARSQGESQAYLKKLEEGTKSYRSLMLLWEQMGGSEIKVEEAFAVHNNILLSAFAAKHTSVTSQVTTDPAVFMSDNWKALEVNGLRGWTIQKYEEWVGKFPWNEDLRVKIVPAVHGTDEQIGYKIITTGFVALAKLDDGFYGKGNYFSTSAKYIFSYFGTKKNPVVIVCFLITGNIYPVIEHPTKSEKPLLGKALLPGYQSHFVLTRRNGYPCSKILSGEDGEEFYTEIVMEQESAILPFYFLKISNKNFDQLTVEFLREQRLLNEEDELGRDASTGDALGRSVGRSTGRSQKSSSRKTPKIKNSNLKNSNLKSSDTTIILNRQLPINEAEDEQQLNEVVANDSDSSSSSEEKPN